MMGKAIIFTKLAILLALKPVLFLVVTTTSTNDEADIHRSEIADALYMNALLAQVGSKLVSTASLNGICGIAQWDMWNYVCD
eukprot:scaffold10260_cov266-Chaetoceros_neogracile.AAC.35